MEVNFDKFFERVPEVLVQCCSVLAVAHLTTMCKVRRSNPTVDSYVFITD